MKGGLQRLAAMFGLISSIAPAKKNKPIATMPDEMAAGHFGHVHNPTAKKRNPSHFNRTKRRLKIKNRRATRRVKHSRKINRKLYESHRLRWQPSDSKAA